MAAKRRRAAKAVSTPGPQQLHSDSVAAAALRVVLNEPVQPEQAPSQSTSTGRKRKKHSKACAGRDNADVAPGKLAALHATPGKRAAHQPKHVEGTFQDGVLYLKDARTSIVYGRERTDAGDLVPVGRWDAATQRVHLQSISELRPHATEKSALHACAEPAREGSHQDQQSRPRPSMPLDLPFACDSEDHCETSAAAYKDIKPLLLRLCTRLGKQPSELRIYDPYFCAGSAVKHLADLGFTNVYNRNEDFYAAIASASVPEHDVLVTNPPFSGTHIEQLLAFCQQHSKPWLLLVPSYVHQKAYYTSILGTAAHSPFFAVPKKRYYFWSPKGAMRNNPKVRKDGRTSPFVTLWHVNMQTSNAHVLKWWQAKGFRASPSMRVYKTPDQIPETLLDAGQASHVRKAPKASRWK